MYHIIEKVEWLNGEVVRAPIGYVTDDNVGLNAFLQEQLVHNQWVLDNMDGLNAGTTSIEEYIGGNPIYLHPSTTSTVDGMGLTEIVDLNNPEGL